MSALAARVGPSFQGAWIGLLVVLWPVAVGFLLARGATVPALVLAALPVVVIATVALLGSDRSVLFGAALGLTLTLPAVNDPLPLTGSVSVFAADLIVLAGVAAWLPSRLAQGGMLRRPRSLRSPVLGAAFVLFSVITLAAAFRGYEAYGASLVGQPLRLILYAAAVALVVDLDARKAWQVLTVVFYTGAVWQALFGLYYLAVGESVAHGADLSTGGTRYLNLDVSFYVAAALFLALLNIRYDPRGRRWLHVAIVLIASFDVIIAFARGTYVAVALIGAVLIVAYRDIRRTLLRAVPILVPLLAAAAFLVPSEAREVAPTFVDRVSLELGSDASVQWRERANSAILAQFHESPLFGVGFGRGASFTLNDVEYVIDQDPHNSWVYLLAGGGAILVGAFVLLLAVYSVDTWRRWRSTRTPEEGLVVVFSAVTVFAFLVNAVAEPLLNYPWILLTIWVLLLLPSIVPHRPRRSLERGTAPPGP